MDEETWSGRANLEHLALVQAVHENFVHAGAEVIIANTFAANRAALEPGGLGARCRGKPERRESGAAGPRGSGRRPVAVAGSMSSFCPVAMHGRGAAAPAGDPDAGDPRFPGLADFREQAELLADAGVDLIALELMESAGYGRAAIEAAAQTGLPGWLGVAPIRLDDGNLGTDPDLGSGDSFEQLLEASSSPNSPRSTSCTPNRKPPGTRSTHPQALCRADRGLRRIG
jgi:S-methylmethionine-dependent homocysteine/selenocysteine methylase